MQMSRRRAITRAAMSRMLCPGYVLPTPPVLLAVLLPVGQNTQEYFLVVRLADPALRNWFQGFFLNFCLRLC